MKTETDDLPVSFDDLAFVSSKRMGRGGWIVRVVGNGSDKSHYHVIRVAEEPGFIGDVVHFYSKWGPYGKGTSFPRNGATIHEYRAQARADKKSRKWTSNYNSWSEQARDEPYGYY